MSFYHLSIVQMAKMLRNLDACLAKAASFAVAKGSSPDALVPGQACYGADYLRELSLPNFYFHVTTAYALPRMAGVSLGKRDYLGSLTLHPVEG